MIRCLLRFIGYPKHINGLLIVSGIKSPAEALSWFMASISGCLKNEDFNIRSSPELSNRLSDVHMEDDDIMASFDEIASRTVC